MNIIRRILKWAGATLAALLLVPFLLIALLYIPPIQNWAVQKAVGFASEAAGMDITLDRVGISFPLDIELENLTACLEGDTLLHTGTVVVDMDFSQIFQGQLGVDGIDIKEGKFNFSVTDTFNIIPIIFNNLIG